MIRIFSVFLIFAFQSVVAGQHYFCEIQETTPISFRTNDADDYLSISIIGESCEAGTIEISITTKSGAVIHHDSSEFEVYADDLSPNEDYESYAKWYVGRISTFAMDSSSRLSKATGVCFPDYGDCSEPTFSAVPKERYIQIKEDNIPTFSQPRSRGSWEIYIYDSKSGKAKLVLYGGH